jgi:hypothetical protein
MESLSFQDLRLDTFDYNDAAHLFEVLSCCSKELGAQGLARIAASSKSLKQACDAIVKRDKHQLIEAASAQWKEAYADYQAATSAAAAARGEAIVAAHCGGLGNDGKPYVAPPMQPFRDAIDAAQAAYELQGHAESWLMGLYAPARTALYEQLAAEEYAAAARELAEIPCRCQQEKQVEQAKLKSGRMLLWSCCKLLSGA